MKIFDFLKSLSGSRSDKTVFCTDCKFYNDEECLHECSEYIDIDTGATMYIKTIHLRMVKSLCGNDAKWFEPK
jgi:hypothetical protein